VEFPGAALAKLTLHQLQHLLFELLAAQVPRWLQGSSPRGNLRFLRLSGMVCPT
jgi:hypothetical protein